MSRIKSSLIAKIAVYCENLERRWQFFPIGGAECLEGLGKFCWTGGSEI